MLFARFSAEADPAAFDSRLSWRLWSPCASPVPALGSLSVAPSFSEELVPCEVVDDFGSSELLLDASDCEACGL